MKASRLLLIVLWLLNFSPSPLSAQTSEDDKRIAELRARAEAGEARAQFDLGRACYNGGISVTQDFAEAVKWFRLAAEQNHAEAQYRLGVCYDLGEGVAQDEVQAYKWWLLAAAQGNGQAWDKKNVALFALSREEIAAAQKLAREFKPGGTNAAAATLAGASPDASGAEILAAHEAPRLKSFAEPAKRKSKAPDSVKAGNVVVLAILIALLVIGFPLWMVIESAQRKQYGWLVAIVLTGIFGALAYFFVGRNTKQL